MKILCLIFVAFCISAFARTVQNIAKQRNLDTNKENHLCELVLQLFQKCYPKECEDINIKEWNVYEKGEPIDSYIVFYDTVERDTIGFLSSVGNSLGLSNQELVDNKVYFLNYENQKLSL